MLCRTWFGETTTLIPFPNRSPKLHDTDFKLHQNPNSISQKKRESPPVTSTTTANQTTKREKKNQQNPQITINGVLYSIQNLPNAWMITRTNFRDPETNTKWEPNSRTEVGNSRGSSHSYLSFFQFLFLIALEFDEEDVGIVDFPIRLSAKRGEEMVCCSRKRKEQRSGFLSPWLPWKVREEEEKSHASLRSARGTDVQRVLVWKCQKLKKRKRHTQGYTKLCSALCQPSV